MTPQELEAKWETYNCEQAFCYLTGQQERPGPIAWPDVVEIVAESEGEHDERSWVAVGTLKDSRAFLLEASCDYTGWDCQAGGSSVIGKRIEDVIHPLCMTDEVRSRVGDRLWAAGFVVHTNAQDLGEAPLVETHTG